MNRGARWYAALLLAPGVIAGCAGSSASVDRSVYRAHRIGLGAFFGPAELDIDEKLATQPAKPEGWGKSITEELYPEVVAAVSEAIRPAVLVTGDAVRQAPSYAESPGQLSARLQASPAGLRPLSLDVTDQAAAGQVAQGAQVDALMLIMNVWSLHERDNKPYAKNEMRILIVDPTGHRVWEQRIEQTSAESDVTVADASKEMTWIVDQTIASRLVREAVRRSIEVFKREWTSLR